MVGDLNERDNRTSMNSSVGRTLCLTRINICWQISPRLVQEIHVHVAGFHLNRNFCCPGTGTFSGHLNLFNKFEKIKFETKLETKVRIEVQKQLMFELGQSRHAKIQLNWNF